MVCFRHSVYTVQYCTVLYTHILGTSGEFPGSFRQQFRQQVLILYNTICLHPQYFYCYRCYTSCPAVTHTFIGVSHILSTNMTHL